MNILLRYGYEQQLAGAPLFFDNGRYRGLAAPFRTHAQGLQELQATARPHAIAVVGGRQDAAAPRVGVVAQLAVGQGCYKQAPQTGRASGRERVGEEGESRGVTGTI